MTDEEEASATAADGEGEEDLAAMLDLSKKKKKKKKKDKSEKSSKTKSSPAEEGGPTNGEGDNEKAGTADGVDSDLAERQRRLIAELDNSALAGIDDPYDKKALYTYEDLLDRVVRILHDNNPDLIEKKRRNMKPPQLTRVGTKKTLWVNFQEICTMMQRSPDHVYQFFMAELGTEGSIDGQGRLVIRGKYVPKYIESLLRKYIVEYVTCQMCRSPNTELTKDSGSRLHFCKCGDCGSSRSVAPIRSGYHATSRADRRAARAAKG